MSNHDRQTIMEAVGDSPRVTVADVAAQSGLPFNVVERQLKILAVEYGGWLEVTDRGEIAYCFQSLQNRVISSEIRSALAQSGRRLLDSAAYCLKLFIGAGLALSLAFVAAVLWNFTLLLLRGSEFAQRSRLEYMRTHTNAKATAREFWCHAERFLLDCHQFVLGPPAPEHVEQKQWHLIAELIRRHRGVLINEQLAPYMFKGFRPGREEAILPVLLRFNGRPEVSARGNIIYRFEDLQSTAQDDKHASMPRYLKQPEAPFFGLPPERLYPVMIVIGVNFLALHAVPFFLPIPLLIKLWWCSMFYALALVAIPALRCACVLFHNAFIDMGNARRREWLQKLDHPSQDLFLKLVEAKDYAVQRHDVRADTVVYTTAKDLLQQEIEGAGTA